MLIVCADEVTEETPSTFNVACFAEASLSQYRRFVEGDCAKLRQELLPHGINVTTYIVQTQGNVTFFLLQAANYPNMKVIIGSNTRLYTFMVALAAQYPNIYWVANRIPTRMNTTVPWNTIWLNYHEPIVWFLKGVLAARFSDKNNFVISFPRFEGLFVVPMNIYLAGLRYVKPNANLTAILDPNFGQFAAQVVQFAVDRIPNWDVFASFPSWTFLPSNLSLAGKWEIGNQISVNSPQSDKDAQLTPTTLAATIYNVVPLWKDVVLRIKKGENMTRYYALVTKLDGTDLVTISRISPVVSFWTKIAVLALKKEYLDCTNDRHPELYCKDFISKVYREVLPIPNGCLDQTQSVESNLLHPSIAVIPLPPPS